VPIDRGWTSSRRELVCSREHAYVENLFSFLLDLKLTVVVYYCPFAPERWSSSNTSQRYYRHQCDVLYPALHHGPYWVSLTPSSMTHFLTYPNHFSLFGTIARNASLLSTYAFYLAWFTGLQIVIDVSQIILFFRQSRESLIQNCIDGSTDEEVQNICNNSFNASKWSIVVSMVIGLIIQFCEFHFFH
jgi:hypothetical protein